MVGRSGGWGKTILGLGLLFFSGLATRAQAPAWWVQRGVIDPQATADDYALINQGQLKKLASAAYAELQAGLPGGAGTSLAALLADWLQPAERDDYATVNQGQLKSLAKLFYDRLRVVGYVGAPLQPGQIYPWTQQTTDDSSYAYANIGQAKRLFSFDLSSDVDFNGVPDWQTHAYGGSINDPEGDADSDGVSNQDEMAAGTSPVNADSDGDSANDGNDQYPIDERRSEDLPVVQYAAIDLMAGLQPPGELRNITLNNANEAGFYYEDETGYYPYTWKDGVRTALDPLPATRTVDSGNVVRSYHVKGIDSQGALLGTYSDEVSAGAPPAIRDRPRSGFFSSKGTDSISPHNGAGVAGISTSDGHGILGTYSEFGGPAQIITGTIEAPEFISFESHLQYFPSLLSTLGVAHAGTHRDGRGAVSETKKLGELEPNGTSIPRAVNANGQVLGEASIQPNPDFPDPDPGAGTTAFLFAGSSMMDLRLKLATKYRKQISLSGSQGYGLLADTGDVRISGADLQGPGRGSLVPGRYLIQGNQISRYIAPVGYNLGSVSLNSNGLIAAVGVEDGQEQAKPMVLLPVEIKATSYGFPPTSLPGKYTKAPRNGSIDNLISIWPSEELTLTVELPEPFKSNPPAGFISWAVPGHTVPDRTTDFKMSWIDTGFKDVTIKVGETAFRVVIDQPNVGNISQGDALLGVNPVSAASIVQFGLEAMNYANDPANFPAASPKKDAIRHSFWTALCASDPILTDPQAALFVTTAHEHNNKWGVGTFGGATAPQQAFNSTMDLRSNIIGLATVHTRVQAPDRPAILQDLNTQYQQGMMWIYDGDTSEAASQGILSKSNRKKIFP